MQHQNSSSNNRIAVPAAPYTITFHLVEDDNFKLGPAETIVVSLLDGHERLRSGQEHVRRQWARHVHHPQV